ncbi:MAG: glycosyltransferase, partial [Acidobacteriia bacterium]|nr:glycosyltransferase [Terriglobia bacterium]
NVIDTTPVPPERVITLFDAVDTDLFSPGRERRNNVRRQFGFDDSLVIVGFVGRFSQGKGHEELLSAADTIRKKRENVRFLVVGEASYGEEPYERRIRSMAHAMGLDAVVTFAGFRTDVPAVMSANATMT